MAVKGFKTNEGDEGSVRPGETARERQVRETREMYARARKADPNYMKPREDHDAVVGSFWNDMRSRSHDSVENERLGARFSVDPTSRYQTSLTEGLGIRPRWQQQVLPSAIKRPDL